MGSKMIFRKLKTFLSRLLIRYDPSYYSSETIKLICSYYKALGYVDSCDG
jgi:hypothetical protein